MMSTNFEYRPNMSHDAEERLSFAIAGAQKCGTTTLDAWLREHARVAMGRVKESHFFDREAGIDWHNPDYTPLHAAYEADGRLRGDATPITLFWPTAQKRMFDYNPDMKLIVLLRDPVERAFSQWRMSRRNGWEALSFSEAIREGRQRLIEDGPTSMAARRFSYVERGFYARQLRGLADLFGWERILVLEQAALATEADLLLRRVTDFLGIAPMSAPRGQSLNAAPDDGETLAAADRAWLKDIYRADLDDLAGLTGIRL